MVQCQHYEMHGSQDQIGRCKREATRRLKHKDNEKSKGFCDTHAEERLKDPRLGWTEVE